MSVSGATLLPSQGDTSIPDQTTPEFSYEYVDGGFYYSVAHSTRGRQFVSLPGLTSIQVQELFEQGKVFPPENLDGNESFAFTHGWQIGSNKVGIVAEDGVLSCTVFDETGKISDEEISKSNIFGKQPAGKIYSRYSQLYPIVNSAGKVVFFEFKCENEGFYYKDAHSILGRTFVSLPGLTVTQVQELFEQRKVVSAKTLDGDDPFGFTHEWQIGSNLVEIVAEKGVLSCTVSDGTGKIIFDEKVSQHKFNGNPFTAGEIYCRYSRLTPILNPAGKVVFIECENGGFYYRVADSNRRREFVSLPGYTSVQVKELFDQGKVNAPKKLDGNDSFGFTHGWSIGTNKVGIVAEDGVLCCTLYDENKKIISNEKIPQYDTDGKPLPAGKIYSIYSRLTPFVHPDGKVNFVLPTGKGIFLVQPINGDDALPKWGWGDKTLSLLKEDGQLVWQIFDRATETTRRIPFANITLENPGDKFYAERLYNELPSLECPQSLLTSEQVNFDQLLKSASNGVIERVLIRRITRLIQTFFLKVCDTSDNQIEPLLFSPSQACISTKSRLDPNITINESRWAVTLVNVMPPKWRHGHAILLIEKVEDGQYKMMKAHLTVDGNMSDAVFGTSPGKVKYSETDPSFPYHSKTETWSLPRHNVEQMIDEIKEEVEKQEEGDISVFFTGGGHGSVLKSSYIQTPSGPKLVENCLTWAINKLLSYDAELSHLPDGLLMDRPIEYISAYEKCKELMKLKDRIVRMGPTYLQVRRDIQRALEDSPIAALQVLESSQRRLIPPPLTRNTPNLATRYASRVGTSWVYLGVSLADRLRRN